MKRLWVLAFGLQAVCAVFAGGEREPAHLERTPAAYFDGDGGEGASITILPINGKDIPAEENYLPSMIQGEFMANFSEYSNISVLDRINLENNYAELYSGYYDDDSKELDMGHLPPTTYIMNGSVAKTAYGGYTLQIHITKTSDKMMAASYSGTCTFEELHNFTGIRRASSKLLEKLGVHLTQAGRQELESAADAKTVNAQTALAKANAAAPTTFARMQYTYEAAAIDPSLKEAAQRLSAYQAAALEIPAFSAPALAAPTFTLPQLKPIRTGNIGSDARADLARYRATQASIKEQQQLLLRQRDEVLAQWREFLLRLDERRRTLRNQQEALFRRQGELEALLQESQAFYEKHPPFRILYDPKAERFGTIDYKNATLNLQFQIVSDPMSIDALKDVVDALLRLNKSFAAVNEAFERVNAVMDAQLNKVESAMAALKDALAAVNSAGTQYNVEHVSADWTVPPGDTMNGRALTARWTVDYPRTFSITASLLNEAGDVIGHGSASLANEISWNGPLNPETAFVWCRFNNVKIEDITDTLTVRIDTVNSIDAETAVLTGYIAIDADGARTAAVGKKTAARESWRTYWTDASSFASLGAAVGTAFSTPAFLASAKLTVSPFAYSFFEAGSDFGFIHAAWDVKDVGYLSIAPYLHFNFVTGNRSSSGGVRLYLGVGGGASFSRYTYPSESRIDPVAVNTWVVDFIPVGILFGSAHSVIDFRYTVKTNFKGVDNRLTLGYSYRFGYFD